ncbi:MAG TPA: indole-3-glycerol-phosphate synthase [Candidatus Akkermansia intestinavium]|nr:indole-3-glycerol-phosphate synthase [Candidatus Akkermansia intestinavium]
MNLQRFIHAKQNELRALRQHIPEPLDESAAFPGGKRPDFLSTLTAPLTNGAPLHIIAEYKRASPSAGIINAERSPRQAARQYSAGGAACMSVLTEEQYFRGSTADLEAAASAAPGLPLLRKDFIFDELQVRQSFATPASALLLIVALTPSASQLRDLRELAESRGLHAVVEIFSEAELDIARTSGARIIQVNARNLETFATDRRAGLSLAGRRLPGECWIAASAMSRPEHLQDASAAGYQAALIGTALMKAPDPERELRQLLHPGIAT